MGILKYDFIVIRKYIWLLLRLQSHDMNMEFLRMTRHALRAFSCCSPPHFLGPLDFCVQPDNMKCAWFVMTIYHAGHMWCPQPLQLPGSHGNHWSWNVHSKTFFVHVMLVFVFLRWNALICSCSGNDVRCLTCWRPSSEQYKSCSRSMWSPPLLS